MTKCGLLGRKLGHSYSPQIHKFLGDYPYSLFEKEPNELECFLKYGDYTGINVTVPYKKDVIPYLDELTDVAKRLGAVNTIVRRGGKLIGHNTDYFGFLTMVRSSGLDVRAKKVLVLGSGGASNTAVAVMEELGAKAVVISRSSKNNYGNLELHQDASIIVNTTPVGMYPITDASPLALDGFPILEGLLDVIYNPARTELLLQAERRGIVAMNGLLMLVAQAKEAAEWFTGNSISDDIIPVIHRNLRSQTENIILIGMPGSGKSTIGRILADKLGKSFVDADAVLTENAGVSIPEIFAREGEPYFRKLETQTLKTLGSRSGLVLATGGGCVTRAENYTHLHRNGTIFLLTRELDALPTDGRPLSRQGSLQEMYRIRKPMYEAFADYTVANNRDPRETAEEIIRIWEELV